MDRPQFFIQRSAVIKGIEEILMKIQIDHFLAYTVVIILTLEIIILRFFSGVALLMNIQKNMMGIS